MKYTNSTSQLFPYMGSKGSLVVPIGNKISAELKRCGDIYSEPRFCDCCCGSMSVSLAVLNTYSNRIQFYANDLNSCVINFFRVILTKWTEFQPFLKMLVDGPGIPSILKAEKSLSDIQQAILFLIEQRNSFRGIQQALDSFNKSNHQKSWETLEHLFNRTMNLLQRCNTRLTNMDLFEMLAKWSSKPVDNAVFYIDPPYFDLERVYVESATGFDHAKLSETLNRLITISDYPVFVSYNDRPELLTLYPEASWIHTRLPLRNSPNHKSKCEILLQSKRTAINKKKTVKK